jgi:hypothetical protein
MECLSHFCCSSFVLFASSAKVELLPTRIYKLLLPQILKMHLIKATVVPTILLLSQISAECTNWTSTFWGADSQSSFTPSKSIILDIQYCDGTENCYIPAKTYDIIAPRTLNISVSPVDEENIFTLARTGYYGRGNSSLGPMFTTLDTTITPIPAIDNVFLRIRPGFNHTLGFQPYMRKSHGLLSGCSNASLEGVGVEAMTPYMVNATMRTDYQQRVVNGSVVAGMLIATSNNVTKDKEDKKSAGERIDASLWSAKLLGVAVACGVGLL